MNLSHEAASKTSVWLLNILASVCAILLAAGVSAVVASDRHQSEQLAAISTDVRWIKAQFGDYYTKSHDDAVVGELHAKDAEQDRQLDDVKQRVSRLEQYRAAH